MMAYRAGGIDVPRTTFDQVNVGVPVYSVDQLRSGDLIFTAGSDGSVSSPRHVGLYLGNGLVIDAPETGQATQITDLAPYWKYSATAIRRIVN